MPVYCTFTLNKRETSEFVCAGFGSVEAYSGHNEGRDNPGEICEKDLGPIPPGIYYIIDRQSGGTFGWARDFLEPLFGSTDRRSWFMLWNAYGGDMTNVCNIRRGNFRLHPEGALRLSQGCITVRDHADFDRLQRYIRMRKPDMAVPGTELKAYGRVIVQ